MREKLIEILSKNFSEYCRLSVIAGSTKITGVTLDAGRFADYLIASGVTVATDDDVGGKDPGYGWIPISLFSPEGECLAVATIKGMPSYGEMLIGYIGRNGLSASGYIAESDTEILLDVTHWMPLPEPPITK